MKPELLKNFRKGENCMKLKRSLALVLALLMVLPLAACGKTTDDTDGTATTTGSAGTVTTTTVEPAETDPTGEGETDVTAETDESGNTVTTTVVTDVNGSTVTQPSNNGTTTSGKTTKTTKTTKIGSTGNNTIGEAITIKTGTTPVEKGLNFGGKTYRFAYYGGSWDSNHEKWHQDFQKLYNVKLDVKGVPMEEYVAALSSALASGKPYDIVFFYSFDYPSQITANVMQPLDDYITTADLWNPKTSPTQGGFTKSLSQAMSLNGHIYCVAGNYLQSATMIYYNKKEFAKAGYTGSKDPLAMYNAGKWSWQELYNMLSAMQQTDKGIYGINAIAPYYSHQFINSFDTDFAKLKNGSLVENLSDKKLYNALEMLKKFCYGEHKVTNPKDATDNGSEAFVNGTTLSFIQSTGAYWTLYKEIPSASAFDKKMSNLGMVPLPTNGKNGPNSIWDWMGYGAGAGASKEGVLCALAFAKYDSIVNHMQAYHPQMPADLKKLSCGILDADNLIGPMDGFKSSAGSLYSIGGKITGAVATKGQSISVVLKSYKKLTQTVIDQALKG